MSSICILAGPFLRRVTIVWALIVVAANFPPYPAAQSQTPVSAPQAQARFQARIDLVEVDVFPTDASGRLITTLTRDDFEVTEDGRLQTVSTFAFVNIPIVEADAARPSRGSASEASDVQINTASGRLYVIVLDDVHTGRSQSVYVKTLATRFIERWMDPGDVAAVAYASGNGVLSQEFTSDKAQLLESVGHFLGSSPGGTGAAVATLTGLSEYLAGVKGSRKICLYFSEGFPSPLTGSVFKDLTDAANRGNVSMYTMSPGGLAGLANLASASQASVLQSDARPPDARALHRAERVREQGMRWLADETGGFAIVGTNALDSGLDRIKQEASSYYLLGYYPGDARRPGAEHKIRVRVRNRPGVNVRARKGYVEPGGSAPSARPGLVAKGVPPKLMPALQYPVPQGGIRLSAMAAPFKDETGSQWASVTVQFDGRDLDLSPSGALDVAVLAIDAQGAVRGHDVRRLDLSLDAATKARVVEHGLRVQARVPVTPGAIGLRLAAADGSGPRVGSLWFDLEVPDYARALLSLSGIVMSDNRADMAPTANADEDLRKALQAPVSTRRQFGPADSIVWMVEVYRSPMVDAGLEIATTIRAAADGREVFRQQRQAKGAGRTERVVDRASLVDFSPGSYVLRIEARSAGTPEAVARELTFRIVDVAR